MAVLFPQPATPADCLRCGSWERRQRVRLGRGPGARGPTGRCALPDGVERVVLGRPLAEYVASARRVWFPCRRRHLHELSEDPDRYNRLDVTNVSQKMSSVAPLQLRQSLGFPMSLDRRASLSGAPHYRPPGALGWRFIDPPDPNRVNRPVPPGTTSRYI